MTDVFNELASEAKVEVEDLVEHLKKAQPNMKPLLDYYQTELSKLKNELHADQTIKDIEALLYEFY